MGRNVNRNTKARIRLEVYARDGWKCLHCGLSPIVPDGYDGYRALRCTDPSCPGPPCHILELDHVTPYSLGGRFEVSNLQTLCNSCNCRKGVKV